jgi:hypothetical protein
MASDKSHATSLLVLIVASATLYLYLGWRHHVHADDPAPEPAAFEHVQVTPQEVERMQRLVPSVEAAISDASAHMRADVTAATVDRAFATGSVARCPVDVHHAFDRVYGNPIVHVRALPVGSDDGLDSLRAEVATAQDQLARHALTEKTVERIDQAARSLGYVAIVIGKKTDSIVLGKYYTEGRTDGDAVVYDLHARALACAGRIAVTTPSKVVVESVKMKGIDGQFPMEDPGRALDRELYDNELRTLAIELRAVP